RAIPPVLPPAGATLPPGSYDIQQNQFTLYQQGSLSSLKPDPKASDGQAAVMTSNHTQWAIQFHIPAGAPYLGKGPWRCSIVVRVDPKQKTGPAFNIGVHTPKSNTSQGTQSISLDQAGDGEYHPYTFILDALYPNQFFWISPAGDTVSNIYVDRIFIQKIPSH
ncbi:MAG TPA: hypothetical protein VFE58_02650, partial [Tepidisphaeraceae bacterium]|nr:hypothetical protein [Tepidisphaeraceae bacterium]